MRPHATKLLLVIILAMAQTLYAGEFGETAAADAAATVEQPAINLANDAGAQAVFESQTGPGVRFEASLTAEEQLRDYARAKQFSDGWDGKKKRMFAFQQASFNVEDPRYDTSFLIKRDMAAKEAVLRAKTDIIRFIGSQMSAMDQVEIPGTDLYAELNGEYETARRRYAAQQAAMAGLLEQVDATEAKALSGATFGDRLDALMEAAIKRLGSEFDAGKIEESHKKRYETAKSRYEEASAELEKLRKRAEELKGKATASFSSAVSVQASMPLMGATVIQQAESWDSNSEQYQVAVLLCWSVELEKAARAAIVGELPEEGAKTGRQSLNEWLEGQELSAMVGPRQFLDSSGNRYFVGITARPVAKDAGLDRKNREIADMYAMQMAVFSLFADIDSQFEARTLQQTVSSGDLDKGADVKVAESLAQRLTQRFENMRVQGLAPLLRKKIRHALTGEDMHIAVYGISPEAAAAAMKLERQAALSAIQFHQDQSFKAGRSGALKQAIADSVNDSESRRAGERLGRSEVEAARNRQGADRKPEQAAPTGKTASGSVMSGDVDDDF